MGAVESSREAAVEGDGLDVVGRPRPKKTPQGQLLKTYRLKKRWSQDELARRSGVSQTVISLIENGRQSQNTVILKLARTLGVDPFDLAGPLDAP